MIAARLPRRYSPSAARRFRRRRRWGAGTAAGPAL